MKSHKAQMKIQQMAFMLMAVTLFFVLVGMFVLVFRYSGLRQSATDLEEENAMLLVTKLANSPEFSCGKSFGNIKLNCIDTDKAMMLKQNINKYSGFWGKQVSNIDIHRIYPISNEIECSLGNYPNCDVIRMQAGVAGYYHGNFALLCRKEIINGETYDKCELGKVMVGYESE